MAKVVVLECDDCGGRDQVETFEIRQGAARAKVDLCMDHSGLLKDYLKTGAPKPRQRRVARGTGRGKVTSMDEIEALKKA